MRKLNRTVVAGGVLYSAGTAATPELEAAIANPEFWDGEGAEKSEAPKPRRRPAARPKQSESEKP